MTKIRSLSLLLASLLVALAAHAQLDETCTVAVLNRTARVDERGFWLLPNVPTNMGPVRARATCVRDGRTITGVSDLFTIPRGGVRFAPEIRFTAPVPVPASMTLTASRVTLGAAGETAQIEAIVRNADGSTRDVTPASEGTTYTTSNPAVVTVSENGTVTATGTGLVIVSAINEGALALLRISAGGPADTDGDGIPDDIERSLGLDPNDPTDAAADLDGDGLTNLREYQLGTDLRNADTDGDGIRDGLEVQLATDPLDPRSFDLARALRRVDVTPSRVVLRPNRLFGQATQQLTVTGLLLDGASIDLTSPTRGTNYQSSDLSVCNFSDRPGELFAGVDGSCTVTVTSNGFTVDVPVNVYSIRAEGLGVVKIAGYANNVKVRDRYAFVAAGSGGLQVVDARDPRAPVIVGSLPLTGTAIDLRIRDDYAYIAAGNAGLHVVRISSPTLPALVATIDTPGIAQDVWLDGNRAYVADGFAGMQIIDIANPLAPAVIGSLEAIGEINALSVSGTVAVLTAPTGEIITVDVSQPAAPRSMGSTFATASPKDVVVSGTLAYIAAFTGGLQIVDVSDAAVPRLIASTGQLFVPRDLLVRGNTVLLAEQLFPNAVPFVDVSDPANPVFRDILDLTSLGDYAGTGIDADAELVYVTGEKFFAGADFGTTGDTALMIARYDQMADTGGVAPTVSITAPAPDQTWVHGALETISLSVADDVAVDRAIVVVNGQTIELRDPYRTTFLVPGGITSATIEATVFDRGGNTGRAPSFTIPVIPDPLTTVRGTVRTAEGAAVPGATVTLDERETTTTDTAGTYEFTSIATLTGDLTVKATATVAGTPQAASTKAAPVRGGITTIDLVLGELPLGIVTSIDSPAANGIDIRNNLAALATGFEFFGDAIRSEFLYDAQLDLIDISNPLVPVLRGSIALPGLPSDVRLTATRAYVAARESGLLIVDISDPSAPVLAGSVPDTNGAVSLALNGSTLYVATRARGLLIYDISGPSPQLQSTRTFTRPLRKLTLSGTLLAVNEDADVIGGILRDSPTWLIDVTDPSAPAILGRVITEHEGEALAILGTRLFVVDDRLHVFDITTPANPRELPSPLSEFNVHGLAGSGNRLIVTGIDRQPPNDIAAVIDVERSIRLTDALVPNPFGYVGGTIALAPPYAVMTTLASRGGRLYILKYTP